MFGRGYYYKLKKEEIMGRYSIDGFLDNKIIVGREEMFDGLPAYNPIFLKNHPDVIVIIAISRGIIGVYYQIKKLGIADDNIVFCHQMQPSFDVADNIFSHNARIYAKDNIIHIKDQDGEWQILSDDDYKQYIKHYVNNYIYDIKLINQLSIKPVSESFGLEYGKPIDRVYIEKFLNINKEYITGHILEVAENYYTNKYAYGTYISHIMHVLGGNGMKK